MREIKFRAWNGKTMKNVRLDNVREADDGDLSFTDGEIDHGHYRDLNHFPLMQFTGLRDKNGKEIYEGDVVDSSATQEGYSDSYGVLTYSPGHLSFYIEEDDGFHYINPRNSLTVHGDIYRNPDLLKS